MASKGERNNNPGNLEASPWTRGQPGYVGSDGRFAIFDTMASGIAAQTKLLFDKYLAKGYNTVSDIIWRYGNDPGTADDVSVKNYIKYVSKRLGVGENDTLTAGQLPSLSQAMREFETGNTVKGVGGLGNSAADTAKSMAEWAKAVLSGEARGETWTEWVKRKNKELDPAKLGEDAREAVDNMSPVAWLKSFFTGETAGRFASVIIGVILVALAIAAFIFLSEQKVVQSVTGKVA